MPHVLFIVDRIESRTPVKVNTHYVLNNRDNRLKVNVAAFNKLVFRREPAAMKFFLLSSSSDGADNPCKLIRDWGYVHDCYHPLPNQRGQGKEGNATLFHYESEAYSRSHTLVYSIAMDEEARIKQWHLGSRPDGSYYAELPDRSHSVSLALADQQQWILNHHHHASSRTFQITDTAVHESIIP